MMFKTLINKNNLKEFEILSGKFKGMVISWWKNNHQHIDLMENKSTCYGENLYLTKKQKNLSNKEIKNIARIILNYKETLI